MMSAMLRRILSPAGMAEAVVDFLETVDVGKDQRIEHDAALAVVDARDCAVEGAPVPDQRQRVGVGELLVFLELGLDAFQLGRLVAERGHDLLAVVDRRDGCRRHHVDDLLQQVLADHVAAVQPLGRLVEHAAVFFQMAALVAQDGGDVLELAGDRLARMLDDAGAVIVGKELAADAVELVLGRPVAQRDDLEAELVVRSGQCLVENLVVAGQADNAQLPHRCNHRRRKIRRRFGLSGGRLHRHSIPVASVRRSAHLAHIASMDSVQTGGAPSFEAILARGCAPPDAILILVHHRRRRAKNFLNSKEFRLAAASAGENLTLGDEDRRFPWRNVPANVFAPHAKSCDSEAAKRHEWGGR